MEQSPIIYTYNYEGTKKALIETHAKNGRTVKFNKKYLLIALLLLVLYFISILISYPNPKYSFLIVIFLILFSLSLFYKPYFAWQKHLVNKNIIAVKKVFEKYQFYIVTFAEEDITIETNMEKNIQKWQEVTDVMLEGKLCYFINGGTTYFYVKRSMVPEDVTRLKELINKKTGHTAAT